MNLLIYVAGNFVRLSGDTSKPVDYVMGDKMSRKENTSLCLAIVLVLMVSTLLGCGSNNDSNQQKTSENNNDAVTSPNTNNVAGSSAAPAQQVDPYQNNDSASRQETKPTQADERYTTSPDGYQESSAETSQNQKIRTVEKVAGPFGPFSSQSDAEPQPMPDATPPPPPESPRGPFGPFPMTQ